jgi:hypothetical protein
MVLALEVKETIWGALGEGFCCGGDAPTPRHPASVNISQANPTSKLR